MDLVVVLKMILLIGVCHCINWHAFHKFSWDDVKRPAQNVYNRLGDETTGTDDDARDFFVRKWKRMSIKKTLVKAGYPDFNRAIDMTLVRTSGPIGNNHVTIEVLSYFNLDILWSIRRNGILTQSFGDLQKHNNMFISSLTLTRQDINNIDQLRCFIPFTNDFINIEFHLSELFIASLQSLGQLSSTYSGPFSESLQSDGTFEFNIDIPKSAFRNGLFLQYAYFNTNNTSDEQIIFEILDFRKMTITQGKTQIRTKLGNYKIGEFLLLLLNSKRAATFSMFTAHRIDIPRNEPSSSNSIAFEVSFDGLETFKFPRNIHYGALPCYAVGQPTPKIEIYKNETKLETVSFPSLRAATTALVSLNGHTIEEVAGTYVCKATSGSKTIQRVLIVEEGI